MKKPGLLLSILSIAALIPFNLLSQGISESSLNLRSVIQSAFKYNSDLKIIESELELGLIESKLEITSLKPQIHAYGKYHWYWADQPELIFPENEGAILSNGTSSGPYPLQIGLPQNLAVGMNVEQRIYDQRFFLSKRGNQIFNSVSQNKIKIGKEELAYEIARLHFEISELQSRKTTIEFNKKRLNKAIKILEIQVKNNMTPETDLEKAILQLQKLDASEMRLENGLEQKSDYLRSLCGIEGNGVIAIETDISDTIPLLLIQGIDSINLPPSYTLLENLKKSNELKLEYQKANHLPSLDFFADVRLVSQTEDFSFFQSGVVNNQSFLGLKLDIPIYSGDLYKKQKLKTGLQNDIYRLQQQKIESGQQLQINRYKLELNSLHAEWLIQVKLETIALKVLNQTESKFEKGIVNINELFSAEAEYVNAGKEKNELLLKIKLAEIDLLKASGHLEILYK